MAKLRSIVVVKLGLIVGITLEVVAETKFKLEI